MQADVQQTAEQYLEVFLGLRRRGRWTSPSVLRYAALALMSCGVDERAVNEVIDIAAVLRKQGGWTSPMRSPVRCVMAAILHRRGLDPLAVSNRIERIRHDFPRHGLRKGGGSAALSCFILALTVDDSQSNRRKTLGRMAAVLDGWRRDHPIITQNDDYPSAALFARRGLEPDEVARRTEAIFQGLRALGLGGLARNALQYSSQILALGPLDPVSAVENFRRAVETLRAGGIRIGVNSWDEVACLCHTAPQLEASLERCIRLKKAIISAPKRPIKPLAFTLATGLVLAQTDHDNGLDDDLRDLTSLIAAQRLVDNQAAA